MSIYSFKMYEWRYFTARGSCDHLKMLSVLCVLSLRIPSFYIDACPHTCPGDARFSLICSFFLDYSRDYQPVSLMTLFSCWFNRKTLFICNQLIFIHKACTTGATLDSTSTYQWGFQESLIHDQSPWWLVHPYTMALLAVHHQYLRFNNTRVSYLKWGKNVIHRAPKLSVCDFNTGIH